MSNQQHAKQSPVSIEHIAKLGETALFPQCKEKDRRPAPDDATSAADSTKKASLACGPGRAALPCWPCASLLPVS